MFGLFKKRERIVSPEIARVIELMDQDQFRVDKKDPCNGHQRVYRQAEGLKSIRLYVHDTFDEVSLEFDKQSISLSRDEHKAILAANRRRVLRARERAEAARLKAQEDFKNYIF